VAGFVVVLDANVLYGIEVTDLTATMATRRLFRPHWSPEILDEVVRNLSRRPDLDPQVMGSQPGAGEPVGHVSHPNHSLGRKWNVLVVA